jgi:predicted transcriptional regulator
MSDENTQNDNNINAVELAAELTAAWLSNANTRTTADDVPAFMRAIHQTILELGVSADAGPAEKAPAGDEFTPAVTVRKSLANPDFLISLIDGKPYKTLTRHLSTNGLTPDEYRTRYGLKKDYPMTAPSYSAQRREMAKKIGLGRKAGQKAPGRTAAKAK